MSHDFNNTPKYQIIENDILDKINLGIYNANHQLPSESQLALDYNCSRVTVRQALSNLEYRGRIVKQQGKGTIVKTPKNYEKANTIKSFTDEMAERGLTVKTKVISFTTTIAGTTLAEILGIQPDDMIYYFERLRYCNGKAFMYEKTFMSVAMHPDISMHILESSKYLYAQQHGILPEVSVQKISPIFAPEYIADALNISSHQPIIRAENTTYTKNGTVFDYTENYINNNYYQLSFVKKL